MSLTDLAGILTKQANSRNAVTLNAATLTSAGFTVTAGLDALLVASFNLPAKSSLSVATTAAQIGTPTATQLTFTGSITALNVTVSNVTVVFTANGSALTFTLLAPLGDWQFNTSWENMAGFPYDYLQLGTPAFVFSSDPVTGYSWGNYSLDLIAGLNLASTLPISGFLEPILQFVPGYSGHPLLLSGSLNPAGVDNNDVLYPVTDLSAPIADTPVAPVAFLKFVNPRVGLTITNEQEMNELVQVEEIFFGLDVDLGDQTVLNCRATLFQSSPALQLTVASDPLKPLSLEVIFNILMGGNTWFGVIPRPLQQLFTTFGFKNFTANIATKPKLALNSVGLTVGTVRPWPIFDQFKINEIDLTWFIRNPTSGPQMSGLLTAEFEFFPNIFKAPDGGPGVFSVSIDTNLRISGSYEGTVSFTDLVSGITGGAIQIPPTFSLMFTGFGLLVDQPNRTYSLNASADLVLDVLGTGNISLTGIQLQFGASYNKSTSKYDFSASFAGMLALGDNFGLLLNASYEGARSLWHFDGGLAPGVAINLSSLLNQVFQAIDLPPFVPGNLQVATLAVTVDITTGAAPNKKYTFSGGLSWTFSKTPLGNVEIDAALQLAYDSTVPATPYSGTISGEFKIQAINADVVLGYSFQKGNSLLFLKWAGFEAKYDTSTAIITFSIADWTLGGLVGELVRLVTNDPTFSLPEPWNLLNSISLRGFSVNFNLTTKQVSASYNFSGSLNLFFIKITAITFTKDASGVNIALTATMIGDDTPKNYNVDPVNGTAPAVPGQNTTKFELQLLALGQRVTVDGIAQQQRIADVINLLGSFAPGTPNKVPVSPDPAKGQPRYDSGSNWLIGTHFLVLKDQKTGLALLDLMAVFNDPYLYGLRIAMAGPSAKIFAGLEFEIMYRKVTDTVGVYELVLQLPSAMRTLEFGEVSITLPVVALQIYTNGNFLIDFGFPRNLDFSRSFTLQAFPFTGSGGFYFGILNGDTATQIRKSTKGTFDPVLVFGIGLQVGLGKSINAGVLSATLSVTVFGIIEGVIARFKPYSPSTSHLLVASQALTDSQAATDYYFWLQGTIGIIGKVQGTVDFAIISATLSITVTIQAQITVEAYRAIPISVSAGVSVSLSVSINLGLFKITIHFSFNYTVSASFTIGSNSIGPWEPWENDSARLPMARRHRPALHLTAESHPWLHRAASFVPLRATAGITLNLYFAPHLTLADAAISSTTQAAYVGMFYIQAPVQQGGGESPGLTDFESLAAETFVWAATTFSNTTGNLTRAEALSQILSAHEVQSSYQYFTANGPLPPLDYQSQIQPFLASQFTLNIVPPPSAEVPGAAVFPMIPELTLAVPSYNGSTALNSVFSEFPMAQPDYLTGLQNTLKQLAVELTTPLQQQYANTPPVTRAQSSIAKPQTLATLLIQDYFALICRQTLQAASDAFGNYTYVAQPSDTLASIVSALNQFGRGGSYNTLTAAGLATTNRTIPLTGNQAVTLTGVSYAVAANQTLSQLAKVFSLAPAAVATSNQLLSGLLAPNKKATINGAPYTTGPNDTFASIAGETHATLDQVAAGLQDVAGLLIPLTPVAIPNFVYTTSPVNTDTFESIANSFNLAIADVGSANTALGFYASTPAPSLDIADLEYLPASNLVSAMEGSGLFAHLAGMCTRFLMNGLRVPINSNLALAPGSPYTGLTAGGMYGVNGQQCTLPTLAPPDANKLVIAISAAASPSWITFPTGNALHFPVDANQITAINGVVAAARGGLFPNVTSISGINVALEGPARFAFQSSVPLQLPVPLTLPNGSAPSQTVPSPTVWNFSSGLLSLLAQPQLEAPVFSLQLGSTAGATGVPVNTPANNFGWATLINVLVKTFPAAPNQSANAANTYQLLGTDSTGITLLERLVETLTTTNYPIQGLYLLYPPHPTAPASQGLIGADPAHLASYIVQSNLSTFTNPGASSFRALFESGPTTVPGILNDPNDFVRRMWETSIVQSGGFFLYYGADQPAATALPQNLFNQDGQARISLLIVYGNTSGTLQPYMNAVMVNDRIDVSNTTLFVESVAQPVTYSSSTSDSLTTIAGQFLLAPSELAEQLAEVTLATGPTLTIGSPAYQVHPGDTLASIATRFSTTGAAIQQANPNLQVDWNNLPLWLLLNIPGTTYPLTAASPYRTLSAIAGFYGLDVSALVWPNLTVAGLFSGTLSFNNQSIAKSAALAPGNAGVAVARTAVGTDQTNPTVYLDATFNLLGWQIASNIAFLPSPAGPPASPIDSMDQDELLDHAMHHPAPRLAAANGAPADWSYEQLFPVTAYARFNPLASTTENLPPGGDNPYSGIGSTIQVLLGWQDLFGNLGITPLTQPTLGPSPLNEPPVLVAYTDQLVSLAQWPGVSADYLIQLAGTQPTLKFTLSFDSCRYYHTPPAPPSTTPPFPAWQQRGLADRQTYAQLYYQINQSDAAGNPHTTFAITSTLEPGVTHTLAGSDLTSVNAFVLQAWQFLNDMLTGSTSPTPAPGTLILSIPVAAANPLDIYELEASFTLARNPQFVHPDFRDQAGVVSAVSQLSTRLNDWLPAPDCSKTQPQPTRSLDFFADTFEAAFTGASSSLHVATGPDRTAAAGSTKPVWGVRLANDLSGTLGLQIQGPPVFYAPPPISTSPISHTKVPIYSFDPQTGLNTTTPTYPAFKDIDLDVWGRQALDAIDLLLSSQIAPNAFLVDNLGSTSHLANILGNKKTIAQGIAGTVTNILKSPEDIASDALAAAQERLRQQMLITLASAYTVDAVVQLPVKVNAVPEPGFEPPALYGAPEILGSSSVTLRGQESAPPEYTLSTYKFNLETGTTWLTFLFSTRFAQDRAFVQLQLAYPVTNIEHQVGSLDQPSSINGYTPSSWLTFVKPLPPVPLQSPDLATVQIPVVLRAYPPIPVLNTQAGISAASSQSATSTVESAKLWDYQYGFQFPHAAQDEVGASTELNLAPATALRAAFSIDALFAALAQLTAVSPQLQQIFTGEMSQITLATLTKDPGFVHSQNALAAMDTLVGSLAKAWSGSNAVRRFASEPVEKPQLTLNYTIQEVPSKQESGPDLLEVIVTELPSVPPVVPAGLPTPPSPVEWFADYPFTKQAPDSFGVLYYNSAGDFLRYDDARQEVARTVMLPGMDVMAYQNALSSVFVTRNALLIPGNPTRTNFVYTTPNVAFPAKLTPLLQNDQPIAVEAIQTGTPVRAPLFNQLQSLFAAFFANASSSRPIKLVINYQYTVGAAGSGLTVQVPITLLPWATFQIPGDYSPANPCPEPVTDSSPLVCKLASTLQSWFSANNPSAVEGILLFDLSVFSSLSAGQGAPKMPLIRLSNLQLTRRYVSDL